ncbi:CBO0543 family protein [Neobacillus drentensis]|uniref:CBO0543 family protein n=1 Tax=Neobacillus drentensis TaxID=220684 RepID=UPI002FFD8723
MAEIIGVSTWILAAVRWGDWRNWYIYYPTILYFILGDALYYYVTYNHQLWSLVPTWPLKHELACLAGEFIVFACTVLIFLGRYPSGHIVSIWWTAVWVFIYTANEWILLLTGTFKYHHGWMLYHSFLFNILLFTLLRFHFKKPLFTMVLSIPITLILIHINSIPVK